MRLVLAAQAASVSRVPYAVDAHSTFLGMCRHFLLACLYIYIAAWGMTPLMELARGTDQCAGPHGSPLDVPNLVSPELHEPQVTIAYV
jgi:hypothetical protein